MNTLSLCICTGNYFSVFTNREPEIDLVLVTHIITKTEYKYKVILLNMFVVIFGFLFLKKDEVRLKEQKCQMIRRIYNIQNSFTYL